ncbi:helix-turn-helix domain-containing protein [Tamlana fucoidanivorans]|uniref:Helix-turn-helix domain-containing protein n=1 Tax=Allotamlana fucoidanivorans TaxID=2583814 RepID=A0A5C4SFR3_9FLAO|nr:helix-turn-helix domain-containing protein [Tamlana fucoidanivorans]TNJ42445.1 helix-turn-helix domain-containing protein [Tamlana fucoidanivorans]
MSGPASIKDSFVENIIRLIDDNLGNEQFGVNDLAKALGVSRSQLHRKLNAVVGKSTTQFIREYRLGKAMDMLKNNEATASEIAYRVGFSSPTYFNSSFKDYFGYPPGEVKYRSSIPTEHNNESHVGINGVSASSYSGTFARNYGNVFSKLNILVVLILLITVSALFYFFFNMPKENSLTSVGAYDLGHTAIAVMPFENLSNDEENQYFVDGMRDDIINHLSKVKSIVVKSRQSADRYGSSDLSGLEIGKALNVDYMIDGSVQKNGDRIKVIVHLINAKNDTHLWSKDFDRPFEDVFNLEKDISTQIASELDVVLSPIEIQKIEKIPTNNKEAYNLYLKGKYFTYLEMGEYKNPEENYELSEKYFKESIEKDPTFVLSYAGLAELLLCKGYPSVSEADYLKAKYYAAQALQLDSSLAEPHRVMGLINMEYEWDWKEAEKELLKALEIDPTNASVNIEYARYLIHVKGDFKKGREFIERAKKLAPVAYFMYIVSAEAYLLTGEYTLALQDANETIEINPENLWGYWIKFLVYVNQGKNDLAIKQLVYSWGLLPNTRVNIDPMLAVYQKDGIPGVFKWINYLDIEYAEDDRTFHNAYWIAEKFAVLNDRENTMKWLHIAYNKRNSQLYSVKFNHFFKGMRTHPEFIEFLKKMNLGGYENHHII